MFEQISSLWKSPLTPEAERVLGLLKTSPEVKRLEQQEQAQRIEQQITERAKLEEIRSQREAEIPVLKADLDAQCEKENKAVAAAKEATAARCRAATKLSLREDWFHRQENLSWAKIRELAPSCIAERQKKWRDLIDEARLKVKAEERLTGPTVFGVASYIYTSNTAAVQRRIDAISQAIKSAERLKMTPLPEPEILQRLDETEKDIPVLTSEVEIKTVRAPDISEFQRTGR